MSRPTPAPRQKNVPPRYEDRNNDPIVIENLEKSAPEIEKLTRKGLQQLQNENEHKGFKSEINELRIQNDLDHERFDAALSKNDAEHTALKMKIAELEKRLELLGKGKVTEVAKRVLTKEKPASGTERRVYELCCNAYECVLQLTSTQSMVDHAS